MNDNSFQMDRQANEDNLYDRVRRLEAEIASIKRSKLPEFNGHEPSSILDDVVGARFISPASDVEDAEPTSPNFSGVAMGGDGWEFNGSVYNLVGVLLGALQAGFNKFGKFVFGATTGTLDDTGVSLEAANGSLTDLNSYKFVSGGTVVSKIGHWLTAGWTSLWINVEEMAGRISRVFIQAQSSTEAQTELNANDGVGHDAKLQLYSAGGATYAYLTADEIDLDGTVLKQGAANGFASLDANTHVVEAIQRIVSGTAALTATEGYVEWQSITKRLLSYDAQRERSLSSVGWVSNALPMIYDPSAALTTAYSIAANGGTLVVPIIVDGHMLLQGVTVRNTDTGTVRSWRWHLYEQYLNNGNSGENTLTRIESGNGNDSFTPAGAASNRTLNGTGAPTYLAPGVYWLAIQNVHATNTFGLASTAVGSSAFAPNSAQVKTLTVPLGSTLDLVAATWTKLVDIYAVRMNGRVFGQTTAF